MEQLKQFLGSKIRVLALLVFGTGCGPTARLAGSSCGSWRHDAQGKLLYRAALESDDQMALKRSDPSAAASGKRRLSLDGYRINPGTSYHYVFFDGEPPYDHVRREVLDILARTKKALTSSPVTTL